MKIARQRIVFQHFPANDIIIFHANFRDDHNIGISGHLNLSLNQLLIWIFRFIRIIPDLWICFLCDL